MEIIGRVTKDATVTTLKDGREVVNFSVAMNDYYKPKNSSEKKQITTYVNCAYWLGSKIAALVTKGALVELWGRIGVQAYTVHNEAKATLTFHVNSLKLHGKPKERTAGISKLLPVPATDSTEPMDDMPF